jgi:hypothetical protein
MQPMLQASSSIYLRDKTDFPAPDWLEKIHDFCCHPLALANGRIVTVSEELSFVSKPELEDCSRIFLKIFSYTIWLVPTCIGFLAGRCSTTYQNFHITCSFMEREIHKVDKVDKGLYWVERYQSGHSAEEQDFIVKRFFEKLQQSIIPFNTISDDSDFFQELGLMCPTIEHHNFILEKIKDREESLNKYKKGLTLREKPGFLITLTEEQFKSIFDFDSFWKDRLEIGSFLEELPQALRSLFYPSLAKIEEAFWKRHGYYQERISAEEFGKLLKVLPPFPTPTHFKLFLDYTDIGKSKKIWDNLFSEQYLSGLSTEEKQTFCKTLLKETGGFSSFVEMVRTSYPDIQFFRAFSGDLLFHAITALAYRENKKALADLWKNLTNAQWASLENPMQDFVPIATWGSSNDEKKQEMYKPLHNIVNSMDLIEDSTLRGKIFHFIFARFPTNFIHCWASDFMKKSEDVFPIVEILNILPEIVDSKEALSRSQIYSSVSKHLMKKWSSLKKLEQMDRSERLEFLKKCPATTDDKYCGWGPKRRSLRYHIVENFMLNHDISAELSLDAYRAAGIRGDLEELDNMNGLHDERYL